MLKQKNHQTQAKQNTQHQKILQNYGKCLVLKLHQAKGLKQAELCSVERKDLQPEVCITSGVRGHHGPQDRV